MSQVIRFKATLFIVWALFMAQAVYAEFSAKACRDAVEELDFLKLKKGEREFLAQTLGPALGRRTFFSAPGTYRIERYAKDGLLISDFDDSPNLYVDFMEDGSRAPKVEVTREGWVLSIPKTFDFSAFEDHGIGLIRRLLAGHSLNPFVESPSAQKERKSLGEQELVRRRVQVEATHAAIESSRKFDAGDKQSQRFLYVGPMGSGKSLVIQDLLEERIHAGQPELHIVVTDRIHLMKDRRQDSMKFKKDAFIVSFGGNFSSKDLLSLVRRAKRAKKPIILTTTIQSLDLRLAELNESEARELRGILKTFVYDEAHHGGAPRSMTAFERLIKPEDSKAFLFGTTGTPIHQQQDIEAIFGNRAYWAYLDTARSYRHSKGAFVRSLEDMREQLIRAIEAGELTEVRKPYFINSARFIQGQPEIYQNEDGGFFQLKPELIGQVAARLIPAIAKHKRGFIVANSIKEADRIGTALQEAAAKAGIKRKMAVMHSEVKDHQEVLNRFKAGKLDYLIVVNQLDEGIDIPDLSLLIDLNYSMTPREFLQRLGRLTRLHLGKRSVDMITFFDFNQVDLAEMLLLIDAMTKGRFHYDPLASIGRVQMRNLDPNDLESEETETEISADSEDESSEADRILGGDFTMTDQEFDRAMNDLQKKVQKLFERKQRGAVAMARDLNAFVAIAHRLPQTHWQKAEESRLRAGLNRFREDPDFRAALSAETLNLESALPMRRRSKTEKIAAAIEAANAFVLNWNPEQPPFLPPDGVFVSLPKTLISHPAFMQQHEAFGLLRSSPSAMEQLSPRARFMVQVLHQMLIVPSASLDDGASVLLETVGGTYSGKRVKTHDTWIHLYVQELRKLGWSNLIPAEGGVIDSWLKGIKNLIDSSDTALSTYMKNSITRTTKDLLGLEYRGENYIRTEAAQIQSLFNEFRDSKGDIETRRRKFAAYIQAVSQAMANRWSQRDDFMELITSSARIGFEVVKLDSLFMNRTRMKGAISSDKVALRRFWGYMLERERLAREAGLDSIPVTSELLNMYLLSALFHCGDEHLSKKLGEWIEQGIIVRPPKGSKASN